MASSKPDIEVVINNLTINVDMLDKQLAEGDSLVRSSGKKLQGLSACSLTAVIAGIGGGTVLAGASVNEVVETVGHLVENPEQFPWLTELMESDRGLGKYMMELGVRIMGASPAIAAAIKAGGRAYDKLHAVANRLACSMCPEYKEQQLTDFAERALRYRKAFMRDASSKPLEAAWLHIHSTAPQFGLNLDKDSGAVLRKIAELEKALFAKEAAAEAVHDNAAETPPLHP